jgi:hypothetical protein
VLGERVTLLQLTMVGSVCCMPETYQLLELIVDDCVLQLVFLVRREA